jgi:SAM-dependent methyltransferase
MLRRAVRSKAPLAPAPAESTVRPADETLDQLLARLERERQEADDRYNAALTALDRAMPGAIVLPAAAPQTDDTRLADLNRLWDTAIEAPPESDRSIKGRLRTLVWRLLGPALETQRQFNSAVVDHLNRATPRAQAIDGLLTDLASALEAQTAARMRFDAHLIQYLQTLTWFVDTRDRKVGSDAQVINKALNGISDDWMKRWESLKNREDRWLGEVQHVQRALENVRATSALAQQTSLSLKRDVELLLSRGTADAANPVPTATRPDARAATAPDLDAFKYVAFENEFRGSRDEIRRRLSEYLPRFEGRSDILEIGCGRGEFLDLLRERGISARGLDLNEAMVRETRDRGLDAVVADALEYLDRLPDASLGGLFAAQVVEHLPPAYLARLIETAGHKIRPKGVIILETINPTCWVAFFESYIRDLTHVKPLHPDTLRFLVRAAGFGDVTIELKAPVPEAQRLETLPWKVSVEDPAMQEALEGLIERVNAHATTLNDRLFGYQDYAVIGEK